MSKAVPQCRTVTVHTFRGDRSAFGQRVRRALDDEKRGRGPGPSPVDCLLYAGHTGVSTDRDRTIYGFNPDIGGLSLWQAMERLRNGDAFQGVVSDDTHVFVAAAEQGLTVLTFDVVLPNPSFQTFQRKLSAERKVSQYSYGFPDGDGDCNCTTWLERLALPLLTGSMDEFTGLLGFNMYPRRRFGNCM
ncbi:MAG TPA: hypothetical protein VG122_24725 [Gemmata sp.]|nr:hypothetical protein [Gemmata sp.]